MRPGVTIWPDTSSTSVPAPAASSGPIAATLPPVKPISATASRCCDGSMIRPPLRMRLMALLLTLTTSGRIGRSRDPPHPPRRNTLRYRALSSAYDPITSFSTAQLCVQFQNRPPGRCRPVGVRLIFEETTRIPARNLPASREGNPTRRTHHGSKSFPEIDGRRRRPLRCGSLCHARDLAARGGPRLALRAAGGSGKFRPHLGHPIRGAQRLRHGVG